MLSVLYTIFDSRLSDGDFHSLLSILPQKDQTRIQRFKRWQDRQIHLAGRLLLREGLLEHGLPPGILEHVKTSAYGKPFITNDIEFNLSNSGVCAACAITEDSQIGIDVETLKDIDISDFKSIMSLDKWDNIQNAEDPQESFFAFWTKKEAVLKADGRGFSVPLEQIQIEKNSATISDKEWHIIEIPIEAPYICHLATDNPIDTIFIQRIPPENLYDIVGLSGKPSSLFSEGPPPPGPMPLPL